MGFMVDKKLALILTLKQVNWIYISRPHFKSHFNNILNFTRRPQNSLSSFPCFSERLFILPKWFDESIDLSWSVRIMKGLILEHIPFSCHFWSNISKYYFHCLVMQYFTCKKIIFMLLHFLIWHLACLMFAVAIQWWRHGDIILMSTRTCYCSIKSLNSLTKFVECLISRYYTCGS